MTLDYRAHRDGAAATLVLRGRIDGEAMGTLDTAYTTAVTPSTAVLHLDLTEVEYINSSGIALIVGLLSRARADGHRVTAAGLSDHYRHVFEITRLSDYIDLVESP